ncbi:hypothetical protein BS47DRAFT_1360902 [Hydnum rufescens UP504]|uniref:Uncharacterized protein n=1 Tax=Hydnum rufescens UP504 TaxID=1448309 RepID=A0A9P6B182_9AGAM|nr:hypothetical protein BS47DRAFT_1360902 [Hydnum rufescens UP504]
MQVPPPSDAPPTHYHDGIKLRRKQLLPLTRGFSLEGARCWKTRIIHGFGLHRVLETHLYAADAYPTVYLMFRKPRFQIGLDMIPVQRMARYRQIHWPFYHQFTVVTTVKTPPSALKPEMFSLQTKEGRNVLLDALDPEANGISFRIDRGSRSQLEIESFELASQANFDRIEIILPGTKPLGGPEASDFEVT